MPDSVARLQFQLSCDVIGNLSQINVKQSDVDVVDANFAKLAAKGISIMISSGDSGSGYASDDSTCEGKNGGGTAGVGIDGTVIKTQQVEEVGTYGSTIYPTGISLTQKTVMVVPPPSPNHRHWVLNGAGQGAAISVPLESVAM